MDDKDDLDDSLNGEFPSPRKDSDDALSSSADSEKMTESKRRRMNTPSPAFMVAASPPRFISFDQLMTAANGIANMSLAHEIAVDSNFKLEKLEPEQNSIEKQVKEIMHKAFWDALDEKLKDPPDYSHAIVLMEEVKQNLLGILLPQHQRLKAHINEVLDMDLIRQKIDNDAFDFHYYAEFVISIMARLCAPARDERIKNLREIKEVVPLYKEMFEVLDLMKMDMANFTIQQMRPYLQQQSVDYEKKKFQEFLKTQQEAGTNGLEFTSAWLERSVDKLEKLQEKASQSAEAEATATPPTYVTPARIINEAYMELLEWRDETVFPETLLMDQSRYLELRDKTWRFSLVSSILLVTYNTVGAPIAGVKDLKDKLKTELMVLLQGVNESQIHDLIGSIADRIITDVQASLKEHSFPAMDEARIKVLKGQITDVVKQDHTVNKLIKTRVLDFIRDTLMSNHRSPLKIPPGLSAVEHELSEVCGQFLRLIAHNKAVFGYWYSDIISKLLKLQEDLSPSSPAKKA
ncbi:T-complex protein 11-like protein 1 [Lingula anatina]|uniref:T-complex protein 11-like protein 1 n=1 Tax=Lingula anatina TaxID=7574 RepID=A0A1S3IAZ9_LINAN|nr:T-complex protein 11-like protein 1 [Lingula anatina]XP_013395438.1 T-complex protein 11-like protein 1 [Lingula anatina]|eukprot:XP_013395437.1 T-complex protein 11-like protein 1 [Lingula anatina]